MRWPILVALALAGCASSPSGPEVTFDACAPLSLVPPTTASPDQLASIADAVALWNADGVPDLVIDGGGPRVALVFQEAAPAFYGYYDAPNATVYINSQLEDHRARAIVVAHELGHAYGLVHVTGHASVMNPGNLTVAPNAADRAALAALWGTCP